MKYTCPKCGKTLELSQEALINSEYKTVCPQCLSNLEIVGDYAYIPLDDGSLQLAPDRTEPTPQSSDPVVASQPMVEDVEAQDVTPPPLKATPPPFKGTQATPGEGLDPLFGDAVRLLSTLNSVTPMTLRDNLNIPLERAQNLIYQLERAGIIGPYNNGGPRAILIPHNTNFMGAQPVEGTPIEDIQPQRKSFTMNCGGCVMWLLLIMLLAAIIKSCM